MKQARLTKGAGWTLFLVLMMIFANAAWAEVGRGDANEGQEREAESLVPVGHFVLDNGNRITFRTEPASGELFYTETGALHETGSAFPSELGALSIFERFVILAPDRAPLPRALVGAEQARLADLLDELAAEPAFDATQVRRTLAAVDRLRTLVAERGLVDRTTGTVFASLAAMPLASRVARYAPDLAAAARSIDEGSTRQGTLPPGLTIPHLCFGGGSNELFRRFAATFAGLDLNSRKDQLNFEEFLRVSSGSRKRQSVALVVSCENGTVDGRHRRRKTFGWTTDGTFALRAIDDCVYSVSESGRKKKRRVEYTGGPWATHFNHFRTATDFH